MDQRPDWYDLRSDLVHTGTADIDEDEARSQGHWTRRMYADRVLEWLAAHPTDPLGDLDRAIAALPQGTQDWATAVASGVYPVVSP